MIYFTIFLLLLFGAAMMADFGISSFQGKRPIRISFKESGAKKKRIQINSNTALTRYEKLYLKVDSLLKKIRKDWNYLYRIAGICFVLGIAAGAVIFQDTGLALVTGFAFIPLSYLFILFRSMAARRTELDELENTMSIITNAYLSNDDILRAFQVYIDEVNRYVDERFRKVTPFDEFVSDILLVNPNVERALIILGGKIDNHYFQKWISTLILCTKERRLKSALLPVLNSMNDEKSMQVESDSAMITGWRNYLMTVAVMFAVIPVLKMGNEEWFLILTQTMIGKFLIILMIVTSLVTACYVMKINQPISG